MFNRYKQRKIYTSQYIDNISNIMLGEITKLESSIGNHLNGSRAMQRSEEARSHHKGANDQSTGSRYFLTIQLAETRLGGMRAVLDQPYTEGLQLLQNKHIYKAYNTS